MIVESLISVAIVPIVPTDPVVIISAVHADLYGNVGTGRYLDHLAVKHNSVYFGGLIDLIGSDFGLELLAGVAANDISVSAEKVVLTRSQPVDTEARHHYRPIRPESDGVPGCLRVAPATRGY